eukprot:TRINITY_DN8767_c0_g1_i3.p1 TRINITY_DN8767_c0_g1~~TRINITY_DN8767_c0_g1_i3.p1  ORF type:complete len:794 (+),score=132.61 TRINITY_DN8767_c0_g1_i3:85-2466(+)
MQPDTLLDLQAVQHIDELLAEVANFHRQALAKVAESYCQEIQQLKAESVESQSAQALKEAYGHQIPGIVQEEHEKMIIPRPLDILPSSPPLSEAAPDKGDNTCLSSNTSARMAHRNSLSSTVSISSRSSTRRARPDVQAEIFAGQSASQKSALTALNEATASEPELLPLWRHVKSIGDMSPRTPRASTSRARASATAMTQFSQFFNEPPKGKTDCIIKRLNAFVALPSSPKRIIYEVFGLFLIFFDMIWLPLQAFEPPASLPTDMQGWASILYWTFDIPCSFFVGFVVPSQGIVETRLQKIIKNYVRGWLAFDVLVVAVDWVLTGLSLFGDVDVFAGADYVRMGKAIRLLKLLRLLRMVKAQKALADLTEKIQSESAVIIIGIVKQLFLILFFNHVLACSWFAIGSLDPQRQDTWVKEYELVGKSMLYQYFTSLHWSLTQFTPASMEVFPANDMERTFTVIVILLAMCIFSSFISTITNAVAQLRNINSGRHEQLSKLRRYFLENKVSVPLMACIWSCLHQSAASATKRRRVHEEDIAPVLQSLPAALRLELAEQVYASTLAFHPFFKHYGTYRAPQLNKICSQVHAMSLNVSAELFTVETPAENMFFLVDGSMAYRRQNQAGNDEAPENATSMNSISWAAEAVMWVNWKHAGSLTAMSDCELVRLHADTIQTTLVKGETDFRDVLRYARAFAKYVERYPDKASDLCEDPSLFRQLAWIAFERPENEAQQEASPRLSSRRSTEVDIDEATQELLQQAALRRKLEGEFFYDSSSSASGSSSSSEAFDSGPDSPR